MKEHKISNDITVREFRRHPGWFNVDSEVSIAIGHVAMTSVEIKALYELAFPPKEEEPVKERCDGCKFFSGRSYNGSFCQRYPHHEVLVCSWSWCGEFKPK